MGEQSPKSLKLGKLMSKLLSSGSRVPEGTPMRPAGRETTRVIRAVRITGDKDRVPAPTSGRTAHATRSRGPAIRARNLWAGYATLCSPGQVHRQKQVSKNTMVIFTRIREIMKILSEFDKSIEIQRAQAPEYLTVARPVLEMGTLFPIYIVRIANLWQKHAHFPR